ncbi:MAG: 3-oxosteroid 1-dehydrogenase [Pseudomonadales bacterium]|nr:3-oxosteroid 1-dehydrogenase [Pseudomonadales bacterium]
MIATSTASATDAEAAAGRWDQELDVLVVGSGNGGLTAALCCHDMGAQQVLVIEKGERFGGTSARSGGGIWIPCNDHALAAGAADSLAEARAYLDAVIPREAVAPGMLDAYLQSGPEMLRFLTERTRVRYRSLGMYPDYFSDAPGAKTGHRALEPEPFLLDELGDEWRELMPTHPGMSMQGVIGITMAEAHAFMAGLPGWKRMAARLLATYLTDFPWRFGTRTDRRLTCGSAGVARLRASMRDRNLPLWLRTRLVRLIAADGRVEGAIVERDGKTLAIRARKAVILAAGGFAKNQAMREQYLPAPTSSAWSAAVDTDTGDAIRAAGEIGARLRRMDSAWWVPTFVPPGELPHLAVVERSLPGSCVVNRRGQRLANEAQNYMSFVLAAQARHSAGDPSSPAYLVFDARFRRQYVNGPLLRRGLRPDCVLPRAYFSSKFLVKARTLDALAAGAGIDRDGLLATVARMNEYAGTGKDLEFRRGDTTYDRHYGDPRVQPNPCLGRIDEPPFYAMRMELGDVGTSGGLDTDHDARVRDGDGHPIPGLYAIGNTATGVLVTYPGPGSSIGPPMTFAYRAARHICTAPPPARQIEQEHCP